MSLVNIVDAIFDFTEFKLPGLKFKLSFKTDLEKKIYNYLKPSNYPNFNASFFDDLILKYTESRKPRFVGYFYYRKRKLTSKT